MSSRLAPRSPGEGRRKTGSRFFEIALILLGFCLLPSRNLPAQDWSLLEKYQRTITREKFCNLIDRIYNPSKTVYGWMKFGEEEVQIFDDRTQTNHVFTLEFASLNHPPSERPFQTFKPISELIHLDNPADKPLKGVRIVLDPGHIGGKWAGMEERSVVWANQPVIREGDKNLQVARLIRARLEKAGAEIYMTHDQPEPVTPLRPADFRDEARKTVFEKYKVSEAEALQRKAYFDKIINWHAELAFYRRAEIAQRAENIRKIFMPDLNICNHFNATELSGSRKLTTDNRHVFFINGCYGPDEMENPMTRFLMLSKILEQSLAVEIKVADAISKKMLKVAKLPPVRYGREKYQCPVNDNPYLYARNLAASRQYPGPCIILEPFYMNHAWTAERLAAGDYEGTRTLAGGTYRSLFREYADAVADAIIETYSHWTVSPPSP